MLGNVKGAENPALKMLGVRTEPLEDHGVNDTKVEKFKCLKRTLSQGPNRSVKSHNHATNQRQTGLIKVKTDVVEDDAPKNHLPTLLLHFAAWT